MEENVEPRSDNDNQEKNRAGRSSTPRSAPTIPRSSSMIVSAGQTTVDDQDTFGPDEARAMSPRRSSAEGDEMSNAARLSVREYVFISTIVYLWHIICWSTLAKRVAIHALYTT